MDLSLKGPVGSISCMSMSDNVRLTLRARSARVSSTEVLYLVAS